jgi:hypothetical protein
LIASVGAICRPAVRQSDLEQARWEDHVYLVLWQVARDPDSLKIEWTGPATRAKTQKGEVWFAGVRYRAKNGFGGVNRCDAWVVRGPDQKYLVIDGGDAWNGWKRQVGFKPE